MSGTDVTNLVAYLSDLGLTTNITAESINTSIAADAALSTPTKSVSLTPTMPSNIDFSKGYSNLTLLKNLGSIAVTNHAQDSTAAAIKLFNVNDINNIDNDMSLSLKNISISNRNVCIKKSDLPLADLTNLTLDYHNLGTGLLTDSSKLGPICTGLFESLVNDSTATYNTICEAAYAQIKDFLKVHTPTYDDHPCPSTECNTDPTTLCIESVSISGTSLVIQTGDCGGTSTTLNNPVSDPQISYTKCTNCGNSKTLLRNEVDEVVDDSSALYNRDSNNEVCNHCLVSIGDEKMCNRFLDKEDCNYLGDSYAWVGA